MKAVKIILSPEAEEAYKYLLEKSKTSKIERSILNSFEHKKNLIKINPQYGEPISKALIPPEYRLKYGINNMFWVGLADYWRLLYSLANNGQIEIVAFVLDIKSHPDYDKLMGYKKDRARK